MTTDVPTPEAIYFYHREVMPWLVRYSTTPSFQHDAEGIALLAAFAKAAVEKEREATAPIIEWAREAVTAMKARAGWSIAHDQLRKALSAYDGEKP